MGIQEHWIDKLDSGKWKRFLAVLVGGLLVLGLVMAYNWRGYHNFNTQEAMDAAQVARNFEQGRGYTTMYIRPLSLYLVKERNTDKYAGSLQSTNETEAEVDLYDVKEKMHPDLANAPLYPALLAVWTKTYRLGFDGIDLVRKLPVIGGRIPKVTDEDTNWLWQESRRFSWAAKDFMVAVLNEGLLLILVAMTYLLAKRLFDLNVARMSALLVLGCELLWRFSVSGLSTMLVLVLFMALIWSLVLLEEEFREPKRSLRGVLLLALLPGLLLGLGTLARYSFGWLVIPSLAFLIAYSGRRWVTMSVLTLSLFVAVVGPWVWRNYSVSGTAFGTCGYAVMEGTRFHKHVLERTLKPNFEGNFIIPTTRKIISNSRLILQNDLPQLGGSWIMPFFVVGLMLRFRNPAISRLRYLLLTCMATLVLAQALGRTQLTEDSPQLNTENLVVLLTPLILIFGVSLFFILLDQITMPFPKFRYVVMGLFGFLVCLPMISIFVGPKPYVIVYPPYSPPALSALCSMMRTNEMMMSDIPWAVAWYGQRQCAPLSLNIEEHFYDINDYIKPVRSLYLTQASTDSRFYSDWIAAGEKSWGGFVINCVLQHQIPAMFPLRFQMRGLPPGQFFMADRERWKNPEEILDEMPQEAPPKADASKPKPAK